MHFPLMLLLPFSCFFCCLSIWKRQRIQEEKPDLSFVKCDSQYYTSSRVCPFLGTGKPKMHLITQIFNSFISRVLSCKLQWLFPMLILHQARFMRKMSCWKHLKAFIAVDWNHAQWRSGGKVTLITAFILVCFTSVLKLEHYNAPNWEPWAL